MIRFLPLELSIFCRKQNVEFNLSFLTFKVFLLKTTVVQCMKDYGKKSSTGARDFEFSQRVNNMLYYIST